MVLLFGITIHRYEYEYMFCVWSVQNYKKKKKSQSQTFGQTGGEECLSLFVKGKTTTNAALTSQQESVSNTTERECQ